jgi:hypothetical protein
LQPRLAKQRGAEEKPVLFEMQVAMSSTKHAVFVEQVEVFFGGLVLKCDDEFLGCLVKFIQDALKYT